MRSLIHTFPSLPSAVLVCPFPQVTFNALISAFGRGGRCGEALQLLERMKRQGVHPNVLTISSLVCCLSRSGQPQRALQLFREYRSKANIQVSHPPFIHRPLFLVPFQGPTSRYARPLPSLLIYPSSRFSSKADIQVRQAPPLSAYPSPGNQACLSPAQGYFTPGAWFIRWLC